MDAKNYTDGCCRAPHWMPLPDQPSQIHGAQQARCAPCVEEAFAMGAKGGPAVEAERMAFEAWMRGHHWALCATWDGKSYRGTAEHGEYVCQHAMRTRQLWAAWRDRAALTPSRTGFASEAEG